ncbi:ferredoxin--NADP reductase [Porticoccus sp. W117]|uniref:ferredoxin--NADP reductase n=1 Tax=Porticoccus sp. W117 TaxID=3054777 RepID=UPI0025976E21|nr:ferredoxin--NADP reductase [Porticoccus sp. W117]MDM3871165.1 ferredoxin--NADP reductase [Porticoccus sp. W117]
MEGWVEATVVENKRWNQRLCSLRVTADELPEFRAGQFLRLGLEVDGELVARPYSLVNAPHEAEGEFYFNKVDEGPLSPRLHSLEQGGKVWLSKMVAGFLTLDDIPPGKRLWMLATGTALGPFLSILKTEQVWQQYQQVMLVHGVRSADELAYSDLISEIQKQQGENFVFLKSVTREIVVDALPQRIPDAIAAGHLEALLGVTINPDEDRVMLCGNPGMVEGCVTQLEIKGLKRHRRRNPGQVVMEIYK